MCKKLIFLTSFVLVLSLVCNASGQPTGQILFEYWLDIGGTAVSDLTSAAGYPDSPDQSELLSKFEGPVDWADNYGIRARGYLYPPADGDYTLWISGDDYIEMYLSTDDDPANMALVAEVPGWTGAQEWGKFPEQQSAPITLVAGQKYYIEALMKEGGGGDSLTAAWTGPEIGADLVVIDGAYLSAVLRIAAWGAIPVNGAIDVEDMPVLSWMAGDTVFLHDVYFGTDADLVAAGDASVFQGQQTEAGFAPAEALGRGITYYWKVDVTTGSARSSEFHPGNVWSFTVVDRNTDNWAATVAGDSPAYLDTFVEAGAYDIGALSGDITYEFVVLSNPDETEASMALIGRHGHGDTTVALKYEQWNNLGTYGATVFGVMDYDYGVPIAPGEYTHLTFVSSETTNTTALYVNGVLEGSVDSAITLSGVVGIGRAIQDPEGIGFIDNFDGTIFGVAIYDVALSDADIAKHSDSYFTLEVITEPFDPGTDGLVAYYAFENDANDSSGNELHGTLVGDAKFAEGPAGYGMALDLDGDGDYVDCGLDPQFDITEQITFTYWIKAVALDKGWNTVLSRGDDSWRSSRAGTDNFMEAAVGGTSGNFLFGVTLVDDDKWHHVGAVYDGATFYLYVDGKLDSSEESTGSITVSSFPLYIGNNSQNTDREWTGLIDEVVIYNRALSELEVLYLSGERATPVNPGYDGLVAYYPLENDVLDASGNGNDGTIVGDPIFVDGPAGYGIAMEFDGDDHVDTGNTEDLAEWTIGCWAKSPAAPSGDPSSASGPVHREQNYQFNWNHQSDDFRGSVTISAGGWHAASLGTLEADTWYYLTGTYDGEVLKAYRDSELITTNDAPSGPPASESNSLKLARHAASEQFFTGTVDEAIVYNKVLSAGEIRYLAGFRAMDVPVSDVTGLGDIVQGVPNDGLMDGDNFGWPGAETPDLATDDDTGTKFLHFKGELEPTGFQIEPASGPSVVTGLTFTTANDAPERDPTAFELSGSNDSIDGPYELIASGDIVDFAQETEWPRFTMNDTAITFENDVAYKYYQVMFPFVRDPGSANSMQIAEVELLGVPAPVAHWTFDDGAGTVALDSSGNGNDGILVGDPQWVAGKIGGALEFDGIDDYVDCGNPAVLDITGDITLMCWIKVAAFSKTWETILSKGDDSYRMSRGPGDGDSIHFGANGTGDNLDANTIVTTDTWRHVALVYNGTDKITYIDGHEDARAAASGNINSSGFDFYIGQNSQQADRYLTGLIDDVRIYNQALSATDIIRIASQ